MEIRNSAVVRRVVEDIWNRGELDIADSLFTAAYMNHGGLISDLVHGPEAIKISAAFFRTAFPELHITIEELAANGDKVELHWAAENSSHHAQAAVSPATVTGTTISTLAEGQIMESWTEWDHTSALQRLEIVPLEKGA